MLFRSVEGGPVAVQGGGEEVLGACWAVLMQPSMEQSGGGRKDCEMVTRDWTSEMDPGTSVDTC